MKLYYILPILFFLISCQTKKQISSTASPNTPVEGKITKKDLQSPPFNSWFNDNYNAYNVNKDVLKKLNENPNWKHTTQVKIFMGTWCSDSQAQVPALLKIFDSLNFTSYSIIGLNEEKTSEKGFEEGNNIIKVPTIIFIQNRNEVNRIIESPVETLEMDIVNILVNNTYTPNYMD